MHAFYRLSLPYLFSPGLPDLFHRGPRPFYRPFYLKTIKRALRENQPREMVQIWYTDTSQHVLPTYQVSSLASHGNPLNRRTDGRMDGHSRVHATENDQIDLTRKPATGNGSNLAHRHLLTCSTNIPSFIPRLPREPPQPTSGPGRVHAT